MVKIEGLDSLKVDNGKLPFDKRQKSCFRTPSRVLPQCNFQSNVSMLCVKDPKA